MPRRYGTRAFTVPVDVGTSGLELMVDAEITALESDSYRILSVSHAAVPGDGEPHWMVLIAFAGPPDIAVLREEAERLAGEGGDRVGKLLSDLTRTRSDDHAD